MGIFNQLIVVKWTILYLCLSGHHCYFKKKIALFLTFCEKFSTMKNDDQEGLKENLGV